MKRCLLILYFLAIASAAKADVETVSPETVEEQRQTSSSLELEARGIIPDGGIMVSTQPITPVEKLEQKDPHTQALEELELAKTLLQKGKMEAASDVALAAYDDLIAISIPKRKKDLRKTLLSERHEAATVYIDSSLAYLDHYVARAGKTAEAIAEARDRVHDLRDVAVNYYELLKKLNKTLEQFTVTPSSATTR